MTTMSALPFPPITKQHILNCSYHSWHPSYRSITPKARLVPLPPAFLQYLRQDGIVLPPERNDGISDTDSGVFSDNEGDDDDEEAGDDPSVHWQETHEAIERTIAELGGQVAPKLNWSAPKDAVWIAADNSMNCRTPNDIYLLLKSSDFITHDLAHAFDDTAANEEGKSDPEIPYHLVLRKWINLNPSLEFRGFVRNRRLIALCQRDVNHYEFLFSMRDKFCQSIQLFFDLRLKDSFPDPNFTFDVYIPPPHDRVWLMDFNPWAVRTDPLLFSWTELLTMPEPPPVEPAASNTNEKSAGDGDEISDGVTAGEDQDEQDDVEEIWQPEFRLIRHDDPEAYNFTTSQYSAHKLPKDVVDASRGGEPQLREFALQWQEAQKLAEQQRAEDSDGDE